MDFVQHPWVDAPILKQGAQVIGIEHWRGDRFLIRPYLRRRPRLPIAAGSPRRPAAGEPAPGLNRKWPHRFAPQRNRIATGLIVAEGTKAIKAHIAMCSLAV